MKLLALEEIVLSTGSHNSAEAGMCLMEAVAYIAREPFSDHPACACPTLGVFGRAWNDALDESTRQRLKAYIPRMIGTVRKPVTTRHAPPHITPHPRAPTEKTRDVSPDARKNTVRCCIIPLTQY